MYPADATLLPPVALDDETTPEPRTLRSEDLGSGPEAEVAAAPRPNRPAAAPAVDPLFGFMKAR